MRTKPLYQVLLICLLVALVTACSEAPQVPPVDPYAPPRQVSSQAQDPPQKQGHTNELPIAFFVDL